jgi:hypothetical protein
MCRFALILCYNLLENIFKLFIRAKAYRYMHGSSADVTVMN